MDWVLTLAIVTFLLVLGFLWWNKASTKRHIESGGGNTTGIGGESDPMSGTTKGMRDPDEMRAALDAGAAVTPEQQRRATVKQDH
jgi:hypothetical protein